MTSPKVIRITEEEILEQIKKDDAGFCCSRCGMTSFDDGPAACLDGQLHNMVHVDEAAENSVVGRKFDGDKLRYHLVDPFAIAWLVASLSYGALKYAEENWRNVENARERYYASLMRHLEAWRSGQDDDEESGLPHLSGVLFSAMCLTALHAPRDMAEIQRRTTAAIEKWRAKKEPTNG